MHWKPIKSGTTQASHNYQHLFMHRITIPLRERNHSLYKSPIHPTFRLCQTLLEGLPPNWWHGLFVISGLGVFCYLNAFGKDNLYHELAEANLS